MKERKRYIWEQGDIMYLHDTNLAFARVINSKTQDSRDVQNHNLIQKIIQNGIELIALTED